MYLLIIVHMTNATSCMSRSTLWSKFPISTFTWVPGTALRSPGKCLYPLSHISRPSTLFSEMRSLAEPGACSSGQIVVRRPQGSSCPCRSRTGITAMCHRVPSPRWFWSLNSGLHVYAVTVTYPPQPPPRLLSRFFKATRIPSAALPEILP